MTWHVRILTSYIISNGRQHMQGWHPTAAIAMTTPSIITTTTPVSAKRTGVLVGTRNVAKATGRACPLLKGGARGSLKGGAKGRRRPLECVGQEQRARIARSRQQMTMAMPMTLTRVAKPRQQMTVTDEMSEQSVK